jgi:hypothetical protein
MVRARSIAALGDEKKRAGEGYRVEVVFAFRAFELHPNDRTLAGALLRLIPQDDPQQTVLMTLGDSLCDSEDMADMKALARVRDGLPRMLTKAVALAPNGMSAYVSYSFVAVLDPHSDYAVQMQRVCRELRPELSRSVAALPVAKREWFTEHILDLQNCRAIELPESN